MVVYIARIHQGKSRQVRKIDDNLHLAGKIPNSSDKEELQKKHQINMNLSEHEP